MEGISWKIKDKEQNILYMFGVWVGRLSCRCNEWSLDFWARGSPEQAV